MRGFDFQQLRTFTVVADTGSLSAAVPLLHLSQSTISEQVRKLEERAGMPLFMRSQRGVQLTAAGGRLLEHARRLVALNETAFDELRGRSLAGELRLAITEYFRPGEVAGMLAQLRDCYPQLVLRVRMMKSADIGQAHARGDIDLGITMQVVDGEIDAGLALRREALRWLASPALLAQLPRPLPVVLLPDECLMHRLATDALRREGIAFVASHSAIGVPGLQSMLAAGLGIGCLPASAIADGVEVVGPGEGLPALPDVVFSFTPPRATDPERVEQARSILALRFGR